MVLHADREIIQQCQKVTAEWLKGMGLELKPSKTRITHTLNVTKGKPGFDFLGFSIRQYPVGKTKSGKDCQGRLQGFKTYIKPSKIAIQKQVNKLREVIDCRKHSDQETLIKALNPIIVGWSNYYAHVMSAQTFKKLDNIVYMMLRGWAVYRHAKQNKHWIMGKYWRIDDGQGWVFQPHNSKWRLCRHAKTPIRRHVKVRGSRSPYDGDWLYWSKRLGRHPEVSARVAKLLKNQQGKCQECGLYFRDREKIEVDHIIPKSIGGKDAFYNLQLLHRHCHDKKTTRDTG